MYNKTEDIFLLNFSYFLVEFTLCLQHAIMSQVLKMRSKHFSIVLHRFKQIHNKIWVFYCA